MCCACSSHGCSARWVPVWGAALRAPAAAKYVVLRCACSSRQQQDSAPCCAHYLMGVVGAPCAQQSLYLLHQHTAASTIKPSRRWATPKGRLTPEGKLCHFYA